jgi:hypothetical protein
MQALKVSLCWGRRGGSYYGQLLERIIDIEFSRPITYYVEINNTKLAVKTVKEAKLK